MEDKIKERYAEEEKHERQLYETTNEYEYDEVSPLLESQGYKTEHKQVGDRYVESETVVELTRDMPSEAEITEEAPQAQIRKETKFERKKREERESKAQKAYDSVSGQYRKVGDLYSDLFGVEVKGNVQAYKNLLKEEMKALSLAEDFLLKEQIAKNGSVPELLGKQIRYEFQDQRAKKMREYSDKLEKGSDERKTVKRLLEDEEIKTFKLKKQWKLAKGVADGEINEEELNREKTTITRHERYDFYKSIVKKANPLAPEDSTFQHEGHTYTNIGRAFFGGTKPMYKFKDETGKMWLFKEAVNCWGLPNTQGALVTEAASELQKLISDDLAIQTFSAKINGKVVGSFQEQVDVGTQTTDLFKWQTDTKSETLSENLKNEILREHVVDWLLCNFDTKGENFLIDTNGHLRGIDKEQAFAKLNEKDAQKMSTKYKPNPNDTLYNTVFKKYSEGEFDLDPQETVKYIEKIENKGRKDYMKLFDEMLTNKYGKKGSKREKVEDAIWHRKENLRYEYSAFYQDLMEKREKALSK